MAAALQNLHSAERSSTSRLYVAQRVEPFSCLGRAKNHGHQLAIRIEHRELRVVSEKVDFVDAQQWLRTAALDGDEETVDQPRSQRGGLDAHDMDDHVEVRRDHALTVRVVRVGT